MKRRYKQNSLPLGKVTPEPLLYGPEVKTPPGLEVSEQGDLGLTPLGPLFEHQLKDK